MVIVIGLGQLFVSLAFFALLPSVHLLLNLIASGVGRAYLPSILSYDDTMRLSSDMFIQNPPAHVQLEMLFSALALI